VRVDGRWGSSTLADRSGRVQLFASMLCSIPWPIAVPVVLKIG
jgi:hypothetical protein